MQMPWDNDPVVGTPSAGGSPFGSRPIIHEAPPQPTPRHPDQAQGGQLDNELKRWQIAKMKQEQEEARLKREQAAQMGKGAVHEIANVIDKAYQARDLSDDWFATGFGAGLAKNIGGTPAANVDGLLDTIGANTAFETLQKMREASPTGGALGAISERELDLLKSTISSPKQGQSDKQFRRSMQNIAQAYGRILVKLPGGREVMKQKGWLGGGKKKPQPKSGIQFLGFE
jgi:hypothetical protein